MALPTLTPEARRAALTKAAAIRRERAAVLSEFREGTLTLAALLGRRDRVAGKIPVRQVLEALPGVGKIRAARLLLDLDIAENRRLQGLGPRQRDRLLRLSPSPPTA